MPTNFDPYEPRYTQQKRRDRVSEPLPIHDDTEDDEYFDNVDVIPETQPIDEDAEQAMRSKRSKRREVGDRQTKLGFWRLVTKHFKTLVPRTECTHHQLNSKWTPMHQMIQAFNGYYIQAKRLKESGCDDLQVYERAQLDFEKQFRKAFAHSKAWHILKDQKKWQEQPLTPINVEDFNCDLPNLNENPTPSRQPKGKNKVDSGDASRSSMRDTLASYAAEKKSLLHSQFEHTSVFAKKVMHPMSF
ncbi:myb-like domain, Myb/SANT-like DNA-binding domain protein [Artemisia annua]|uniref:Myb-like domain, Myb/SANT-like DNA-binding domain protein n=1 Tax=Artemisia annua TaxID=35608 RepID=A0A2U1MGC6_ARTAN|nr:myb-like domain, Myb/SANT-like DNA-binding domain protein [Artemisia annua]